MEVTFANPKYLMLLVAIPIMIFLHFYLLKHSKQKALKFANYEAILRVTGGKSLSKNLLILAMRLLIIVSLIFAVTGTTVWYKGVSAKYDIVLAIDSSSSMLVDDYAPNRMEAAKNAATLFVNQLKGDVKVGVVTFSGGTLIKQTPTSDFKKVKKVIADIDIMELGGTDVGQAIITSANLLKNNDNPRMIALLTDGRSNVGIDPDDAVNQIKDEGISIFPIGIATTDGGQLEGIEAVLSLDEDSLKKIADDTGGEYFHATSVETLENSFKEIADFQKKNLHIDISLYLLLVAFVILFFEWGLINTKYKIL